MVNRRCCAALREARGRLARTARASETIPPSRARPGSIPDAPELDFASFFAVGRREILRAFEEGFSTKRKTQAYETPSELKVRLGRARIRGEEVDK